MKIKAINKVQCKTGCAEELEHEGIKFTGSIGLLKTKGGLRDAFVCPPGYVWLTGDYAAEEIRLLGNVSGEVNYIQPIQQGLDIHNYIAKQMFGFEDPSHRTKVKVLNFAVNYGANEYTIARKLEIPVPEAKSLLEKFYTTMGQLTRWKEETIKEARRKGMVFTLFGRPRLLYRYYSSSSSSDHAFADRTAINSPIQGCSPTDGYLETKDKVVLMKNVLAQRVDGRDGKVLIPTHRGESEPILVTFDTGDFAVVDANHKFITGSMDDPKEASIRTGLRFKGKKQKLLLAPLHKKSIPTKWYSPSKALSLIRLRCRKGDEVLKSDKDIASALFSLAISRKWFDCDYTVLIRIRSLASIFGYNVIYSTKKDKFRVAFHRKKTCKVDQFKWLLEEGKTVPVGSCTVVNGLQMYENQGIMNRNTGGDIIRLVFIKLYKRFREDKEFAENCIFANSVHDEVNLYVKKEYLHKAFKILYEIMYFNVPQFKVPIVPDLGVGTSWGTVVDCKSVSEDNKIQLEEFDL